MKQIVVGTVVWLAILLLLLLVVGVVQVEGAAQDKYIIDDDIDMMESKPTVVVDDVDEVIVEHQPKWYNSRKLLSLFGGGKGTSNKDEGTKKWNSDFSATAYSSHLPVSNISVPLHAHSGTHHAHLYVGSPPQRQILILDTGSKSLSFPCKCRTCRNKMESHASPIFDPTKSTTHIRARCGSCQLNGISKCSIVDDSCTFTQKYTEGSSWTAVEVEDMIYFGPSDLSELDKFIPHAIAFPFGCQISSEGLFEDQYADGILGLSIHETSLIKAIHDSGVIAHNAFSLCLTPEGGHLSIGGVAIPNQEKWHGVKMTPITRDHGYYSVQVTKLFMGDEVVASEDHNEDLLEAMNSGKGCIIDSGTTDSFFPMTMGSELATLAKKLTNGLLDFSGGTRRTELSFSEFRRLPEFTVIFVNGAHLSIHPKYYMEGVPLNDKQEVVQWSGKKALINRIYSDEPTGTVIGMNGLLGNEILFDVGKRLLGSISSSCTY